MAIDGRLVRRTADVTVNCLPLRTFFSRQQQSMHAQRNNTLSVCLSVCLSVTLSIYLSCAGIVLQEAQLSPIDPRDALYQC